MEGATLMNQWSMSGLLLCLLASGASPVLADDICGGPEERKNSTAKARAAIVKAEQAGKLPALFLANRAAAADDCVADTLRSQARGQMSKLGRELAKQAEAKGLLYTKAPREGDGSVSAFAWFEAVRAFTEADRVMLKAVRLKPDDLDLFRAAWDVDRLSGQRLREPIYTAPAGYRRELEKSATAAAERLMSREEKEAHELSGSMMTLGVASAKSLATLRQAAEWMKFLPGGDRAAKARAEQRGDAILKREDAGMTGIMALPYYEFAGSPKAAQVRKTQEQHQRAVEESAGKLQDALAEKGDADRQKFEKGKADLEKELGF